jgi:hypothetical protein
MEQLLTQHRFPWQLSGRCFQALISRFGDINWPACSPDLSAPDYFLLGFVKSKMYETHLASTDNLKQQIQEHIQGIPNEILYVMAYMPSKLQECVEKQGHHPEGVIFKQ